MFIKQWDMHVLKCTRLLSSPVLVNVAMFEVSGILPGPATAKDNSWSKAWQERFIMVVIRAQFAEDE